MLVNLPSSANPEPDEELVAELQRMLADARIGKLQGMAAVYYMATEEGAAVMDEIYGWTDVVPADNSEFDVVKQAAEEFGLYDE